MLKIRLPILYPKIAMRIMIATVGLKRTLCLLLKGSVVNSKEASKIGLITKAVSLGKPR